MRYTTAHATPSNVAKGKPRIKTEPFKMIDIPDTDSLLVDLKAEQQRVKFLESELRRLRSEAELKDLEREKSIAEVYHSKDRVPMIVTAELQTNYEKLMKENEELTQKLKFISTVSEGDLLAAKAEIDYWIGQCRSFEANDNISELKAAIELAKKKRRKYKSKYGKLSKDCGTIVKTRPIEEKQSEGGKPEWKKNFKNIEDEIMNVRKQVEEITLQGDYKRKLVNEHVG